MPPPSGCQQIEHQVGSWLDSPPTINSHIKLMVIKAASLTTNARAGDAPQSCETIPWALSCGRICHSHQPQL